MNCSPSGLFLCLIRAPGTPRAQEGPLDFTPREGSKPLLQSGCSPLSPVQHWLWGQETADLQAQDTDCSKGQDGLWAACDFHIQPLALTLQKSVKEVLSPSLRQEILRLRGCPGRLCHCRVVAGPPGRALPPTVHSSLSGLWRGLHAQGYLLPSSLPSGPGALPSQSSRGNVSCRKGAEPSRGRTSAWAFLLPVKPPTSG